MQNWPLLSILIWLPILGGVLVLALGERRAQAARWVSLAVALAVFLISLSLFTGFDAAAMLIASLEKECVASVA